MNGSYWKLFYGELKLKRSGKRTKFWDKGFEILQSIQDRLTLDKSAKRAKDYITNETENRVPEDTTKDKANSPFSSQHCEGVDDINKYSDQME